MLTKEPRRSHGRSARGQAKHSQRVKVADVFLSGKASIAELAAEHCVSIYTVRDWVRDRREHSEYSGSAASRRVLQTDTAMTMSLYGTGGSMSDEGVRRATRDLEKAIMALQAKLRMPTFSYRREPEV